MPARKRPARPRAPGPAAVPRPVVMAARLERPQQDSYGATALGDVVDRSIHAAMARFTTYGQTIGKGHHHVKHGKIKARIGKGLEGRLAIVYCCDFIILKLKHPLNGLTN